MSCCRAVSITTADVNTATVVTVEPPSLSPCLSHSLYVLHSLLVPILASALRTVDGGCGCEALHSAGERRNMPKCTGFGALWPVIHGGCGWRASRACLWVGLHAGGPCAGCQQMSWSHGQQERKERTFFISCTETQQDACRTYSSGWKIVYIQLDKRKYTLCKF